MPLASSCLHLFTSARCQGDLVRGPDTTAFWMTPAYKVLFAGRFCGDSVGLPWALLETLRSSEHRSPCTRSVSPEQFALEASVSSSVKWRGKNRLSVQDCWNTTSKEFDTVLGILLLQWQVWWIFMRDTNNYHRKMPWYRLVKGIFIQKEKKCLS